MKNLMKVLLVIALLCPVAFAEGDQGSGGKTCPVGQTCPTNPGFSTDDSRINDGGEESALSDSSGSVLDDILAYLETMFR